ncbi:hypothetical protein [Pseudobutyrivibrio sp. MD2005]|uniref:hypothetical protein n=1 Tax=Pseudobutyrivibrio sp. MD2005 TaxID=1410616 RepID=UPI000480EE4D|nr:hypothetical protein [Pseudobutyrivibrio sp. MD2005]
MSDEKRREELKAQINERLDMLSIEELEYISGGYTDRPNDGYGRFLVTDKEREALFHFMGKGTCPYCGKVLSLSE